MLRRNPTINEIITLSYFVLIAFVFEVLFLQYFFNILPRL